MSSKYNVINMSKIHQIDTFLFQKPRGINGGHVEKNGRHLGLSIGQSGRFLQPQCITSSHEFDASERLVQNGCHSIETVVHPKWKEGRKELVNLTSIIIIQNIYR